MKPCCRTLLAVVLLSASVVPAADARTRPHAAASSYAYTAVAFLGDATPGGGTYLNFQPSAVNANGQIAFTSGVSPENGEAVFAGAPGALVQLARTGLADPAGNLWSATGELARMGYNRSGEAAFGFLLQPDSDILGVPAGLYRSNPATGGIDAVVEPGQAAPGGGTFAGIDYSMGENLAGDISFTGLIPGSDLDPTNPPGTGGIAGTLFVASHRGPITRIVGPGDPAPGGGVFDTATNSFIDGRGDVSFGGHVQGEDCFHIPQLFACGESSYVRWGATGEIQSIAHQGDASPCGGRPYVLAFGPVVNGRGDVAFPGQLPSETTTSVGIFLWHDGTTRAVACPGDPMPGGGTFVSGPYFDAGYGLNPRGWVSFSGTVDSDANADGIADSGIYVFEQSKLSVVARTGTEIPGVGTVASVGNQSTAGPAGPPPFGSGGVLNRRGQVLFSATLSDGRVGLFLATPHPAT